MKAKILFVSDLHKRDVDFSTIAGYTKAVDMVQQDILRFIKENNITHLVSLGDWYDKGYRSINRHSNDRNYDEALSEAVNGNFYICLGNHFFLERDNNPEMYLIQPSELYQPIHKIYARAPIIQAVNELRIGSVMISFFHYSKRYRIYKHERPVDVTAHIGVYHDEVVVPGYAQKAAGLIGAAPATHVEEMLSNIDLAIVGHLHKPIGMLKVSLPNRDVPMIIPGSLANTSNGPSYHTEVTLPIVEIDDNDHVSTAAAKFSLHCEMLQLYRKKENVLKAMKPDSAVIDIPKTVSLKEYMRAKGYDEKHMALLDAVTERELTPIEGLHILGLMGENKR